ncbi:RNA12 protein [Sodiomyces alkalinus F11]|uniref:Mitochondrial escape protein 2 n=1 Tax=Sodiomyces alkalinus (strain CBS 110278 / VKM F-3762 / F11) TaxID=1314773 RepID=A0A3N2QA72_SODAK|nr:RNA12 protein [Sodiomyces alkalinus F11]ROT43568.1 RNA12 protein [Sodiomyces alkalinus F11]
MPSDPCEKLITNGLTMIPRSVAYCPALRPRTWAPTRNVSLLSFRAVASLSTERTRRRFARQDSAGGSTTVSRAWNSTLPSEKQSGHISSQENESILFFDNIFPLRLTFLFKRPWQSHQDIADMLGRFNSPTLGLLDPINLVKRAIPKDIPIKVTEILPHLKDGGAFVKVSHGPEVKTEDLEASLTKKLESAPLKPWFNPLRGVKAGLVKGMPWLEDLHRFPKSRLKVEFIPKDPGGEAVELSQEDLYSLFRKYGKIADITSQPAESKVVPKFAHLDFALIRDAIMARNCLHGFLVTEILGGGKNGTKLRLSYERKVKAHSIWNWIVNHPRLVIPVAAGLLAAITVAIFDPIRQFFVKAHIQQTFRLSDNQVYRWLKTRTTDLLAFGHGKSGQDSFNEVWKHRRDLIEKIQTWLLESSDNFIVVQGPRGSGKKDLVLDQALKERKNVLVIDCKPIVEARGESGTIKNLAQSVGYRPVFSWANSMSSLVDLALQSTTGVKAGFSETLESQVTKILHTSAAALKEVSLSGRQKDDKDADISDDAYLEAHPDKRPVVVINNFLHKSDESTIVHEKMAQWAALLVQNNVAHVIFLTSDTSYPKTLSKALPDRVFRQIALGDLSPDIAKKFVASRLEADDDGSRPKEGDGKEWARPNLSELDDCIEQLGGRLTDLEFLARRIKGGQTPRHAVDEIISQSATEIVKMFFLGSAKNDSGGRTWSTEQAWYLVKSLARHRSLRYNEILLSDTFASSTTADATDGEAALEGLANAELITVKTQHGRPQTISASKPMYQAAFGILVADRVLQAKMDLAVLKELAKVENRSIERVESELAVLSTLPKQPSQTGERISYLLGKLEGSQRKINEYEKEMGKLKKVLSQTD